MYCLFHFQVDTLFSSVIIETYPSCFFRTAPCLVNAAVRNLKHVMEPHWRSEPSSSSVYLLSEFPRCRSMLAESGECSSLIGWHQTTQFSDWLTQNIINIWLFSADENYTMCGPSFEPNFYFMWPGANIQHHNHHQPESDQPDKKPKKKLSAFDFELGSSGWAAGNTRFWLVDTDNTNLWLVARSDSVWCCDCSTWHTCHPGQSSANINVSPRATQRWERIREECCQDVVTRPCAHHILQTEVRM